MVRRVRTIALASLLAIAALLYEFLLCPYVTPNGTHQWSHWIGGDPPPWLPVTMGLSQQIRLRAFWLRDARCDSPLDLIAWTTLPEVEPAALKGEKKWRWSSLLPGSGAYLTSVSPDARSFEHEIPLPPGTHRVTIDGSCGVVSRDVTVPDTSDAVTVTFELPAPDHSELIVALSVESHRARVFPAITFRRTPIAHPSDVPRGGHIRLRRLMPGDYEIGGVTCHRPIHVPPSSVTRVRIGRGQCDVHSWPRPN